MRYYNIPIFVPHYGCPFDCVFCNQKHITGEKNPVSSARVREIINEHLETIDAAGSHVEAAFFGGSFTAIEPELQEELLGAAYEFLKEGRICGIRLSTRPDFINDEIMQRLVKYKVTSIELGVQSMSDKVLALSGRGHTAEDVKNAVKIIRKYPIELGLQMMTGLPGDTGAESIETAKEIISLKPDCVRIYPTLVIKDTALYDMYLEGTYKPQTLDGAVRLAAKLIEMFRAENIKLLRVGLAATEEISPGGALAAGPYHAAFGELSEGEIFYNKMLSAAKGGQPAEFEVNPLDISKAVGNGKRNISRLLEKGIKVRLIQNPAVPKGELYIRKVEG